MKSFRFDRSGKTTYRYTPTAAPLRIELAEPVPAGHQARLRLSYEGTIDPDTWLTNVVTPEWVELAMYAAWYPYVPGSKAFTYRLKVKTEAGYVVASPGTLTRTGDGWSVSQQAPTWDIVLAAARDLRLRHVDDGGQGIDVWRVSSQLGDPETDRFAGDVGRIMRDLRAGTARSRRAG